MQVLVDNIQSYSLLKKMRRWDKLLFWYSFLMAFPSLLFFGQNASLLLFAALVFFIIQNGRVPLLGITKPLQWLAICFALGAILSVVNIPQDAALNALDRALAVLPNYLYWSLLIIILIQHRRLINLDVVYQAVFWGVVCTTVYYLFLQQILLGLPFFNRQTPNSFAFLLVCYAPISVHYLKQRKNRKWALAFLILIVYILLIDGRRAGMVLVFLGGITVLYIDRISWKRMMASVIVIPIFIALIYTDLVESFVFQSSERIHEMIYKTSKIRTEDRSYLTRVVQIKKGMAIFESYPYTGIGLNNFSKFETDFDKSFEGAEYVINKKDIGNKSAHNSYISLLAEGGLFLIIPFLLILGFNIIYFFLNFNRLSACLPVYVGFVAMAIHLYFISDIVNVYAWFLISLASALSFRN